MTSCAVQSTEIVANSYSQTLQRFDSPQAAIRYPSAYRASARDSRERRAILKALDFPPSGRSLLDLPCGTGRLTELLAARGWKVTGADSSPHMVAQAEKAWAERSMDNVTTNGSVQFEVRDVMRTGYADKQFDAVICNRLFHHFTEAETRRRALAELARVTAGPLIVSFFNALAVDAWRFRWKHWRRGTKPTDRIPIPLSAFEADVRAAGLGIVRKIPVLWGISPQWYVVLDHLPS